jgi:SAM-dependent methyltransferase
VAGLSILDQTTKVSSAELDGAKRTQEELNRLYQQHDISARDIHNILQQITWDASADAKAARSVTGNMPTDIETRVDRACEIVAETLRTATIVQSSSSSSPSSRADAKAKSEDARMLDVGCGFGVLVPHLIKAGVQPSQIFGVDLSPEMIRNAHEMHGTKKNGGPFFASVDFLSDEYRGPKLNHDTDNVVGSAGSCFDSIIFCSSLHDMPDVVGAIKKASLLLRPGGKLVLVHPQGASHVLNQVRSNPALVTRGLPDAKELQRLCTDIDIGLELVVEPASSDSKEEALEGYLAVLQKRRIL